MKKAIVLLCAVLALLLASCDRTPGAVGTASGESFESADTAAISEPYVLKSAPEDQNQASLGTVFVETLEGYYYPCEKETQKGTVSLIYFCPRGGDTFRPLCGKPNCRHEDENCNAWFGDGLGYYNGALYAVDYSPVDEYAFQMNVVRMNPDGTDHQVVATVDDSGFKNCAFEFKFHHGKLFVWCKASNELPLDERMDHLVVLDLKDYSQRELASEFLRAASLPSPYIFYKDKLYLLGTGDKSQTFENYNPYDEKLIEVDALTGEVRTVLPQFVSGLYVTDSTWYFFEPDLTSWGYKAENVDPGFREYDPVGGTIQDRGLPTEDILWVRYDENYIYAAGFPRNNDKDQTLYILSRDYKLLDKIELQNGMQIYAIASDRFYLYNRYERTITHYIDKSQIGSGELELIPIKTVK